LFLKTRKKSLCEQKRISDDYDSVAMVQLIEKMAKVTEMKVTRSEKVPELKIYSTGWL
jgi:hypothetical protein